MVNGPVREMPAKPTRRDRFIYWAARFHDDPRFDEWERDYKLTVANRLVAARTALLNGDGSWLDLIDTAITAKPNNLTSWRATQPLQKWFRSQPDQAALALRMLWNDVVPVRKRLNDFVEVVVKDGPGVLIAEAAFFHMANDPYRYPMYRSEQVDKAYHLTGYPTASESGIKDIGGRYEHFLMFLANVTKWAEERGLILRDPQDVQSALWLTTFWDPIGDWPDEDQVAFRVFQSGGTARDSSVKPSRT